MIASPHGEINHHRMPMRREYQTVAYILLYFGFNPGVRGDDESNLSKVYGLASS